LRIALLGTGRIGQLHGRLLGEQPEVDEILIYDPDGSHAQQGAQLAGEHARLVESADEAIDASDAVVIAASTTAHAALVTRSIEAGRPIFVEKPLAFDLEETAGLVELVERSGAIVQLGFQRRFDPAYREAKRRVDAGELGNVYLVRLIAHDQGPPHEAYIPVSGGLFRDSSIHDIDALRWVTGQEVVEVYAAGAVRNFPMFAKYDDIDTGLCIFTLADGTLASHSQTRHNPLGYDIRMEIMGSLDAVAVGLDARTPIRSLEAEPPRTADPGWASFLDRFEAGYRAELQAFLRVARGELPVPCTARDGLEATRVAIAATLSRKEHRPVRIDEVR
jgi:myo-inositol 2-dehydrogenase/D-chiro-inositol 1-dehydrogenase